jgi:hypothetical protein
LTQAKVAPFLALVQALHNTQFTKNFTSGTGIKPEFADSLGALAGGMPTIMITETNNLGEFWPFGPRRGELDVAEKEERSPEKMRAVTAHEFGHLLDFTTPGLYEDFLDRNPNAPKKASYGGQMNVNREALADAFAQSVRKVFPQIGEENARAYAQSKWLTNAHQQALLDSLVQARLSRVPK